MPPLRILSAGAGTLLSISISVCFWIEIITVDGQNRQDVSAERKLNIKQIF